MIQVVFFASIREALGTASLELASADVINVRDVIASLVQNGETWQRALTAENLLVAVNQTMVKPDHPVTDGDEVAFFPPVTGG